MISFTIDASDMRRKMAKVIKFTQDFPKKTAASINKGLTEGKTFATKEITGIYNVGGGSVNIVVHKASAGSLTGDIDGKGGHRHVSEFSPSVSGKVVSATIIRGSSKAITSSSRGPGVSGAFMVGGRVMERRQAERYPIFPVMTIGTPEMLGSHKVADPTQEYMGQVIVDDLTRKMVW
jgi:hypothetical protein